MGTAHGAEELGLCPHGLACQARAACPSYTRSLSFFNLGSGRSPDNFNLGSSRRGALWLVPYT